jgi:hypothetical protein
MTNSKPSDVLSRMRATASRAKQVSTAEADASPVILDAPQEVPLPLLPPKHGASGTPLTLNLNSTRISSALRWRRTRMPARLCAHS